MLFKAKFTLEHKYQIHKCLWIHHILGVRILEAFTLQSRARKKPRLDCPGQVNYLFNNCSWVSENRSLVDQLASEITV